MYYKLMPFWTTTTKKSFSCYKNNPSSILLSPLSRQLSGFFHLLLSKAQIMLTKQKKLHFAWKNNTLVKIKLLVFLTHSKPIQFFITIEISLTQGWKIFCPRDEKLSSRGMESWFSFSVFLFFFHFSKRERGKKPLDWFTKPVMDIFTFVNRIATELVK